MSACPNINAPEWKQLVAEVGEMEAYRDFLTFGEVRNVSDVLATIKTKTRVDSLSNANRFLANYNKAVGQAGLVNLANKLSENLNVEYALVDEANAKLILEEAGQAYSGEAAFFFGGKVYMLPDKMNEETVLHEFAHPLVIGIYNENKTLFNSLYQQAIAIPGVLEHVESQYQDKSDLERQMEAIVYGMTSANQQAPEAKSFLQKVAYALKQIFRKLFGSKINVSKLSPNTSLKEMVEMMQATGFNLKFQNNITDELVFFIRDYTNFYNDLNRVDSTNIEEMLGYSKRAVGQVGNLLDKTNFRDRFQEFARTDENADIISIILGDIGNIDSLSEAEKEKATQELLQKIAQTNLKTLAHTIAQLEQFANNIYDTSLEIREQGADVNVGDALTLFKVANAVSELAIAIHQQLINAGVSDRNTVAQALGNISQRYERAADNIRSAQTEFLIKFMVEKTKGVRGAQEVFYKKTIDELEKQIAATTNSPGTLKELQEKLRGVRKERDKFTIDEVLIRNLVTGRMGDVGSGGKKRDILWGKIKDVHYNFFPFQTYVENFMNISDPAIGTFGMFLNDVYNKAEAEMMRNNEDFREDVFKFLEDAGLNNTNPQEFWSSLTYTDKTARLRENADETDASGLEEFEVISLLNPYKDYLFYIKDINDKIKRAREAGNTTALVELENQKEQNAKYFHRMYTKDYYAAFEKFNTPTGILANLRRKEIYLQIESIEKDLRGNVGMSTDDYDQLLEEKKNLLRQAKRLSSLTDDLGNPKTGIDLEIAQLLKQHKEDTKDFYEYVPIEGLFEARLKRFEEDLVAEGLDPSSESFSLRRDQWIENNTVVAVKPEWRQMKQDILEEMKEIQSRLPGQGRIAEEYEKIFDLTQGFRDASGQPLGDELSGEVQKKITQAHERIEKIKGELAGANGLTRSEFDELQDLFSKKDQGTITDVEFDRLKELLRIKKQSGLGSQDLARLGYLIGQLSDISTSVFTDDYQYVWNSHLARIQAKGEMSELFGEAFGLNTLNEAGPVQIKSLMSNPIFMNTIMGDKVFASWFNSNHYEKEVWDSEEGRRVKQWAPSAAWTISVPKDESAYQTTIIEETGEEIQRIPNGSFTQRRVKDKYINERTVGKTVDVWGNYLPDLSVPNNPFKNQAYEELRKNNPKKFEALEKTTEWYLDRQMSYPISSRLGYQIPRFGKDALELAQDLKDQGKGNFARKLFRPLQEAATETVAKSADDVDRYNYSVGSFIISDFVDDETSQVPVYGISPLEKGRVSMNVAYSILKYTNSAILQSNLIDSNPIAKTYVDVLDASSAQTIASSKKRWLNSKKAQASIPLAAKRKYSTRAKAVGDMYEKVWLGQRIAGGTASQWSAKFLGSAMKMASTAYFAVNIPSAMKNRFAAVVQTNIEAIGGTDINARGYARAKALTGGLAGRAMLELSSSVYSTKSRSKLVNLMMAFDVDGGLAKGMDYTHRSLVRDTANLSFLMAPRKFMQLEGTLELLFGMMASKTIEVTQNGEKKTIALIDAYEMKEGRLVAKEGVPAEWAIGGKEFLKYRRLFDGKMNRLQGTYKEIQQPLLNRYALGKVALFLRKYFVSMLMHRIGAYRVQYDTETMEAGMYRSAAIFVRNLINDYMTRMKTGNWDVSYSLNGELEYLGAKRTGIETLQLIVLGLMTKMVFLLMFGYDPEDKEKKSQSLLKEASGPIWTPFNAPTDREFKLNNWLLLHAGMQGTLVSDEALTFYPGSFLLDAADLNDLGESNLYTSGAGLVSSPFQALWNGTGSRILNISKLMIGAAAGEEDAYYKRDVGPYWFQQEGQPKYIQEMAKIIGLTGKTADPADAYVDWQAGLRLRR